MDATSWGFLKNSQLQTMEIGAAIMSILQLIECIERYFRNKLIVIIYADHGRSWISTQYQALQNYINQPRFNHFVLKLESCQHDIVHHCDKLTILYNP